MCRIITRCVRPVFSGMFYARHVFISMFQICISYPQCIGIMSPVYPHCVSRFTWLFVFNSMGVYENGGISLESQNCHGKNLKIMNQRISVMISYVFIWCHGRFHGNFMVQSTLFLLSPLWLAAVRCAFERAAFLEPRPGDWWRHLETRTGKGPIFVGVLP